MSHTSMYLYLDPLRDKVGEGDLHGYMYKLLLLIIIIIIFFSVLHFTGGLIVLLQHPAGVVLWQLVYISRCSSAKLPLLQDYMAVYYSS